MNKLSLSAVALLLATSITGAAMAEVSATLVISGLSDKQKECVDEHVEHFKGKGHFNELIPQINRSCDNVIRDIRTVTVIAH